MAGPNVLLSSPHMQSLTFTWPGQTRHWAGYRVLEGTAETQPHAVVEQDGRPAADWGPFPEPGGEPFSIQGLDLPRKRWRTAYQEKDSKDPARLEFQTYAGGTAWCSLYEDGGRIRRELCFQPVADGVRMWLRLSTQVPIEGAYLVQQCLRFTGAQNWSLRRQIACVPFLSELDVQAMGHPELTLTYARQGGEWLPFPARHVEYTTPAGSSFSGHDFSGTIDQGLVIRETLDRKAVPASYFRRTAPDQTWERLSSGLYWERTAWVSNRHPADCVHAVIDLGPLAAGESRTVRGKFYWIEGCKDDLLAAWRKDFPISPA